MREMKRNILLIACLYCLATLASTELVAAGEKKDDMGGWELNSPYNRNYNVAELDSFKAKIVKIVEAPPMAGMAPGVILQVQESDEETIDVHVCPIWYRNAEGVGLKRGDMLKIRGVWAEIEGKDVFMASKIKKGDFYVFKVRLTKDGTPFWTMSAEQQAKEQQDKND